jgi:uncharacterized membrane protein YidH (DUF202 family)
MRESDEQEHDHGSARERTVLAWNRAALVVAANGALLVRLGDSRGSALLDGLGAAVAATGVGLWLLSLRRYASASSAAVTRLIAGRPSTLRTLAIFSALVSLIELVVVATGSS